MFIDEGSKLNRSIEPKDGRVSAFTSGPENRHMVEPVTGGTRYIFCPAHTVTLITRTIPGMHLLWASPATQTKQLQILAPLPS